VRPVGDQTRLLHPWIAHPEGAPAEAGLSPALDRSSTYRLDDETELALATRQGIESRDVYGRFGTPTTRAAAELVAAAERAEDAVLFASGMAAVATTFAALLPRGGHLVAANLLYGGTEGMIDVDLPQRDVRVTRFDVGDVEGLARILAAGPADMVWVESIASPLMTVADLDALSAVCKRHGVCLAVDGTFTSGMGTRPLARGADLVVHSVTKFLNGHSDVIGGAVCGSRSSCRSVYAAMVRLGGCIDPMAAWLLARGIRTLPIRWARQTQTAERLAAWLSTRPEVTRVMHPSLDPAARGRLDSSGPMLAFELRDEPTALHFLKALRLVAHATSLGGIETLACSPPRSSHANVAPEKRRALGIPDGLVRISVGLEDPEDLEADLTEAFAAIEAMS
jgi:cystathionine beta-lyase/cystathionine gamma-synthase